MSNTAQIAMPHKHQDGPECATLRDGLSKDQVLGSSVPFH